MNAMEHFREAEQLLEAANDRSEYDEAAGIIAQAHVHATLALAAVTAMSGCWRDDTTQEWRSTFDRPSRRPSGTCSCCDGDPDAVCEACGKHSCWAGLMYCEDAKAAGITGADS